MLVHKCHKWGANNYITRGHVSLSGFPPCCKCPLLPKWVTYAKCASSWYLTYTNVFFIQPYTCNPLVESVDRSEAVFMTLWPIRRRVKAAGSIIKLTMDFLQHSHSCSCSIITKGCVQFTSHRKYEHVQSCTTLSISSESHLQASHSLPGAE